VTLRYVDLVDYVAIAAEVTGLDVATVLKIANLDLADSALHAPAAGFGDTEATVLAIAAGELDEAATADWLGRYLAAPDAD